MIKWEKVVNSVHQSLINNNVSIYDATIGDFEFGALRPTYEVLVAVNKISGAIEMIDAHGLSITAVSANPKIKGNIKWLDFVAWIEDQCLTNGLLPSEVKIDHLEIRPVNLSDIRIYVDKTFKTLSITDGGSRINGS